MITSFSMLRPEQINLAITLAVAAICLSPLATIQQYQFDSPLTKRDSIVYNNASFVAPFFVVLIPLTDLLLDYPSRIAAFFQSVKDHRKTKAPSSVVIRLTDTERLLFIIGVAVQATVGFLPAATPLSTMDIVHNCTGNLSVILTLGPILTFLQRCTITFTTLRCFLVLIPAAIGLCVISLSNFSRSKRTFQPIILCGSFILVFSWLIYMVIITTCAVRYCRQKNSSYSERKACFQWIVDPLKSLKAIQQGKKDLSVDNDSDLYTNYIPALHMISSITIACANAYVSYSPNYNTSATYENKNYAVLVAEILVLVIELRIRKNEIARGLIALLESKKSYVRYISHELRTPLNTAFLGLKLLTNELKSSKNPKDIERYDTLCDVNMSCTAAVDILNDLLCYEKLESGILELHKENITVDSFIKECASMFSAQARECGVTISTVTDTPQAPGRHHDGSKFSLLPLMPEDVLFADKFKMDQVIRNLMSNALKFTPRGGTVTIKAFFQCDTSVEVVKSVVTFSPEQGVDTEATSSPGSTPADSISNMRTKSFQVSDGAADVEECDRDYRSQSCVYYPASSIDASFLTNCLHGKLIVIVTDTGAGISKENQKRLFTEIVQFSPEKLQAGGGSGLGLWITQEILNLHDGSISVSSEGEGMGSSFTIELPMSRWPSSELSASLGRGAGVGLGVGVGAGVSQKTVTTGMDVLVLALESETDEIPSKSEPETQSVPASEPETDQKTNVAHLKALTDLHLLVVDDSRLNRKMLLKCLRADGHTCCEAEDGLEAIAMVKERINRVSGGICRPFDAVLMDFVMPNMDGPTATQEIRALGYTAPIFGVTGNGLPSDIQHFLNCGADRVLLKPLDMNAFRQAMREKNENM